MTSGARGSLRWRLIGWLLAALVVTWGVTVVVSYFDARREVGRLLDAHLALSAALLVAQAGHEMDEIEVEQMPELEHYGRQVAFQIWDSGTVLLLRSARSPQTRLSAQETGFSDSMVASRRWRVYSSWDAQHEVLIQVAEETATRDAIAAAIGRNLLWPLIAVLPALALLIWLVIGRGLRPLQALGQQVTLREPANLSALDASEVPREVAPLVNSLNLLFSRVAASIENERRFTADAAHELRTPLAALRVQAEVARGATSDAERQHALTQVIAACDRAARLVQQMLALARTETGQVRGRVCELGALARRVVAELAPYALAHQVEIALEESGAVEVIGDADLLELMLRNLLDNAVRHGAGPVRVALRRAPGGPEIEVEDQGAGVAATDRVRLGQRFFRPVESGSGCGLGLSIVLRIAALHSAAVRFADGSGNRGLRVTVTFPPASG